MEARPSKRSKTSNRYCNCTKCEGVSFINRNTANSHERRNGCYVPPGFGKPPENAETESPTTPPQPSDQLVEVHPDPLLDGPDNQSTGSIYSTDECSSVTDLSTDGQDMILDGHDGREEVRQICQSLVRLTLQGVTKKHVTDIADSLQVLNPFLPFSIPKTWYLINKEAAIANRVAGDFFAVKCKCGAYTRESHGTCRNKKCGKQIRQRSGRNDTRTKFVCFDLPNYLNLIARDPDMEGHLLYPTTRQRGDGDCWDGMAMRGIEADKEICLSVTCDGAVLYKWKDRSWCPILVRILNLPPESRHNNLFLWACMRKESSLHDVLECLLTENEHLFTAGFQVEGVGHMKLRIARIMEDGRGLQGQLGCSQSGAYTGGCPWCDIKGVRCHNRMVYPGAMRMLPVDHSEREKWRQEFSKVKSLYLFFKKSLNSLYFLDFLDFLDFHQNSL